MLLLFPKTIKHLKFAGSGVLLTKYHDLKTGWLPD